MLKYFTPEWVGFWVVTFAVELLCSWLAYYTLGMSWSFILFVGSVLVAFLSVILHVASTRTRIAKHFSFVMITAYFLVIVPYQFALGIRWINLQHETARIVTWVYEERLAEGSFPKSLALYEFTDQNLERFIQKYESDGEEFILIYFIGTRDTSHWYSPSQGWAYYPD